MKKSITLILLSLVLICFAQSSWSQKKELKEKRSYFSKTFLNEDGSYSIEINAGPVHYLTDEGKYKDIKRKITASNTDYSYEVTEGLYNAYFENNINDEFPVIFETKGSASLKFGLKALVYFDDVSKEYHVT